MDYARLRLWARFPYREDKVFAALFFAVTFVPLIFGSYLNDNIEVPKLALWAICVVIAILAWLKQEHQELKYHKPLLILVGVFLLLSLISTWTSLDIVNSFFGLYGRFTGSLLFYGLWGVTTLLFVSVLTRDKFIFLAKTLVFTSTLIAIFALAQTSGFAYYGGINPEVRQLVPSFLGNPNFAAMFIACVLPFALVFVSQARTAATRIYYIAAILSIILGLAVFASRGALIAAGVSLVIMAASGLLGLGRRVLLYSLASLIVLGVAAGLFLGASRPQVVGQTLQLSENTVDTRFQAWDATFNIIQHYPWWGTGPGNYFIGFNQVATSVFSNTQRFDDAHNLILHLAATGGIIASALFLAILAVTGWNGWQSLRRKSNLLVLALLAASVSWLVSASFTPVTVSCWFLLALLLGGLVMNNVKTKIFIVPGWAQHSLIVLGIVVIGAVMAFVGSDALARDAGAAYQFRQYNRALRSAKWSTYLNPTNPTVSSYWAASRIKLNHKPEDSERIIEYMIKLHPLSPRVRAIAANLYYALHHQTQDMRYLSLVEQNLSLGIALEPNQASINSQVAYTYYKIGNPERALFHTRQALIQDPQQFYSWILLAQLQLEQGNRQAVISALSEALRLQPELTLLKNTLEQARTEPDLNKIIFPVNFPDPSI